MEDCSKTIDYQTRLNTLQNYLTEKNIVVAMITSPANVFYYTGFNSDPHERFMALIVDNRTQEFTLFVPLLDMEAATSGSYVVPTIIPISDEENPFTKLQDKLGENIECYGLEMKAVSMFQHNNLLSITLILFMKISSNSSINSV